VHIDPLLALAGLLVGLTVGLTGMGGGALMTPILVIFFKVDPVAAVSSDVVASLVMKPIGGGVHLRRGTVHKRMVLWLCVGSVPSAFAGVLLLRALGGDDAAGRVKTLLGVVLLIAATSMFVKGWIAARRGDALATNVTEIPVKVLPTVLIGVLGGVVVGMTSVGSGSLMIVLLLFLYPRLQAGQMVGTDLVQAVPLVASATVGHLLFGDVQLAVTGALLIGAVPGVYVGARVSSHAPDRLVRSALVAVLVLSSLKLLNVPNAGLLATMAVFAVTLAVLTMRRRATTGRWIPERLPVAHGGGGPDEVLEQSGL
jgi:uncharacterized membrane protein YfcA